MAYWGKSFKLNKIVDTTCSAIGIPKNPRPNTRARTLSEPGTESRTLSILKAMEVQPGIEFDLVLQTFDYLVTECIPTAEGAVPAHDLVFTDGVEIGKFTGCKVARCEVSIPRGLIEAAVTILSRDYAPITAPTWDSPMVLEPMTFADVQTFTIDSVDLKSYFRDLKFGADNRVVAEFFGTGIKPSEVGEQEAVYHGSVIIPRTAAALMGDVMAGDSVTVVIKLQDHSTPTPVSKTFTFEEAILTLSQIEVAGIGIELEKIEWEPRRLYIS